MRMGVHGKAIGGGDLLDVGSPAKRRRPQDMLSCETHKVSKKCRRHEEIESPCEGITEGSLVLVTEAEAEVKAETAAAAQEVVARAPSRAAYRKEQGGRFKERFDTHEARRGRTETSDSRRKEQRGELLQKKRLNGGGRKAMAGEPTRRAIAAGARMLMHKAVEPQEEPTPRASDVDLLGAFPLLELPEELQLLIAAHVVSSPRDRAALCVAVPPLGRKAIKAIPAYTGPLMSLGNRVLSGGALSEAEVRRYVREFAPSEAEHWSLALNECAQLNAIAAPSARVRCVAHPHPGSSNHLQWRLESGALLRSWQPFASVRNSMYTCLHVYCTRGTPGVHHYEGAAGAERLVALAFADGHVHGFVGERGAELAEYHGWYDAYPYPVRLFDSGVRIARAAADGALQGEHLQRVEK